MTSDPNSNGKDGPHRPGLGRDGGGPRNRLALGHAMVQCFPAPSGWRVYCECGEEFRDRWELETVDRWYAHVDEEIENRESREART